MAACDGYFLFVAANYIVLLLLCNGASVSRIITILYLVSSFAGFGFTKCVISSLFIVQMKEVSAMFCSTQNNGDG